MSYTIVAMPTSGVAEFEAANASGGVDGTKAACDRACRTVAASSSWWELLLN